MSAKPNDGKSSSGVSRRAVLRSGVVVSATAALGGFAATGAAADGGSRGGGPGPKRPTERIRLVNGKIHTIDPRNRIVSSVLIEDGRFVDVGHSSDDDGRGTRTINLKGRTVVPGIIDNHNHIVLMGNRPGYHTPLENAYSTEDVQGIYAERAEDIPDGAWITTIGGFHFNQMAEQRLPTLSELDDAVPDNPAYASVGFSGPSTTNSRGRAFFEGLGIPVGEDGAIAAGADATGRATLSLRQALLDFEQRKRGTLDAIAYGLSLGVTTHLDQGAFQATGTPSDGAAHEDNYTMHLPFLAVHDDGDLDARVQINFLHMDPELEVPTLVERLKNQFPFFGDPMLNTGGIGEFFAQGLGANWLEGARRIAEARWRGEVHSLSATDFQTEIQGFETVHAESDIGDLRWVIAHVPFITEDYVDRLKAVGGGISFFGGSRYLTGATNRNGPPYRMVVDNGIHAGLSCDGMQVAPLNPWLTIYYATTGVNALGMLINDGNQVSRQEALRLYTRDNGWFLRQEDNLGSIEDGKFADLVVLNKNYFTVPDEELKQIRSLLTIVGGRIVHDDLDGKKHKRPWKHR